MTEIINQTIKNSIISIVKSAGQYLTSLYHDNQKKPIINADKLMDDFLAPRLSNRFPHFQIISEESHVTAKIYTEFSIVVDPIDGTYSFDHQSPEFCIGVSLLQCGQPIFGVVYAPIKKLLFWGEAHGASFLIHNEKKGKIFISNNSLLNEISVAISPSYKNDNRGVLLCPAFNKTTYQRSALLRICLTACGAYDSTITLSHPLALWDICAGYSIVKGAGGHMADFNGTDLFCNQTSTLKMYDNFLCTNKKLLTPMLDKISKLSLPRYA